MTQTDDEFHDEVHNAFVQITLQNGKRSFNQQKRALQAWLDKYVPQAEARGLTEGVLAMRRNASSWLLLEAAFAKRPVRAFEPMLRNLEVLGWYDLEERLLSIGAMCSYFADRMWNREGLRYLLPVQREVQREYARTGNKYMAEHLRWLSRIEERLRARRRPF